MAKLKVITETCDNPACGKVSVGELPGYKPDGIYIQRGEWHLDAGGPLARTFACSWECLGPAAEARVDEEWHK